MYNIYELCNILELHKLCSGATYAHLHEYYIVHEYLASSPGPLGEGRKGPGTHRLRMRRFYHVVAIIFPKKFTRVLRIFCRPHGDGPKCAVESAREKPSTTTLPKAV